MKTRTVDEILAKASEMEDLKNWMLEVLDTKTKPSEITKIRQSLISIMSYLNALYYCLEEIKR
jgi:hypothetical protein